MRSVTLLLLLQCGALLLPCGGAWAQKKVTPPPSPSPTLASARAAIQALLTERDKAFGARDAAAYLTSCTTDYVHTDTHQDTIPFEKLRTELQKTLTVAKTAEQKTQLDSFKLEDGAALVETYESLKLFTVSHEWLEITTTGYRRCRYRFVSEGGTKWKLARTRVIEEPLTETPRLRESPGLSELEKRVKAPATQAAVQEIFPLLLELAVGEEQKDFRIFGTRLAPDFVFIRLGKDPEERKPFVEKMTLAHQYIHNERVRYYLVGTEQQENGDVVLDVEQALRFTLEIPEEEKEETLIIVNLSLTWTRSSGAWYLKRHEYFTADGFTNNERDDFVQKQKNKKKEPIRVP